MNNNSSIRALNSVLESLAKNNNEMLSTVERLIKIVNDTQPEKYDEQIALLSRLESILGATV